MIHCAIIADDLTGANATGALFRKMNLKAYTVMNMERIELTTISDCDCILYPTDSRSVQPEIAYNRVYNVCRLLKNKNIMVYSKRIDSTLRGNLGSETDAMLDCLGEDYTAIVVPCFPSSGRSVIGGYLLVNGTPLHKTNIAIDPKTPVKISEAALLFRQQSKYKVSSIQLKDMMYGKQYLADKINQHICEGSRILVMDCITQEDLNLIADAVIISSRKIIAVDPGAFTATLSRKQIIPSLQREKSKILAVIGSVNPNTRTQLEELWLSQKTHNILVDTKAFIGTERQKENEIKRIINEVQNDSEDNTIFTITGNGIYPENRIDFRPYMELYQKSLEEVSGMINQAFAEITYQIFQSDSAFQGLYTSGGDITEAVCRRFNTAGLHIIDEVLPLAAYGKFIKGAFEGIHIVTKGGSQGDRDAITQCINYLKEKLYI